MVSAILMMAGSGSRMNINENKIFLPLGDKMVYEYSLELFLKYQLEVICVIREEDYKYLKKYEGKVKIVIGGATRQQSVYHGLEAASGEYVLIHDAARPFLSEAILKDCLKAIREKNAFLVVAPCKDTIYERYPLKALKRDAYALAQTPQGGLKKELLECHQKALDEHIEVTDDISLIVKYGTSLIKLIEGSDQNFKITTQLDYIIAKEWIKND